MFRVKIECKRGRVKEELQATYKQTVIPVLMQKQHTRLQRHGDLLGAQLAVVRVEDGLAADTALGGGREIEEEGPGGLDLDRGGGGERQGV